MNNKGLGPTLTSIVIGLIIFTGVLLLVFSSDQGIYPLFIQANDQSVDLSGDVNYSNLDAAGIQGQLNTFSGNYTAESKGFLQTVDTIVSNVFLTISTGASALKLFFSIPTIIIGFTNAISNEIGIPAAFSWIFITAITIFMVSKIWKAWKGHNEEP